MEKKTVLFFIYKMGAGGAARTLLNIINNIDRDRFTPVLVTLDFNSDYEMNVDPDVIFIKLNKKRLRQAIFPLGKVIRQVKADIVFSTIPVYNTVAILGNMFSFTRAKNVVREADNLGGTFGKDLKLSVFGLVYKKASQVVSLSEGVKENLIKRYHVKPEDIKVIYNPVDIDHIQKQTNEGIIEREHHHLFTDDEKVIITAGRLVQQKDHRTLLKAFADIRRQVPSKLLILGEGPLQEELMQYAAQLQIEDHVFFLGFQNNPYIYMKQADLFVLTSIHEGFSHVVAEALATGVPVVSTDCKSGPREVLDNGQYGKLCTVGDAENIAENMLEVLSYGEDKRQQVIQAGYERADFFNAQRIVKEYEQTFLDTLADKG
ncbi:MAG TPA: glycosyltransferase [Virgibacillus sp.]|nr:glycosyltransferase [Virgibacillus sp.]